MFDVVQLASKMSLQFESDAVEEDNKDNLVIEASAGLRFDEDNDQSCVQFATEEILAQVVRQRRDSGTNFFIAAKLNVLICCQSVYLEKN